jgi:crossover junction endodeoxyribonuclease RusA
VTITVADPTFVAGETLLSVFIPGTAKPKGSLRHVGGGHLVEQVIGSAEWKRIVADRARAARSGGCAPHLGAVEVEAIVYVAKPPSAPASRVLPIKRSSGDSDKHARNLLDALGSPTPRFRGAGIYNDDSQVTDLIIRKRHAVGRPPGVWLTVRTVEQEQ